MKKSPLKIWLGVITFLGGAFFLAFPFVATAIAEQTGQGCIYGPTGKCDGALAVIFITVPLGLLAMVAGLTLLFEKSNQATAASQPKVTPAVKKRVWILMAAGMGVVVLSNFAANQVSALDSGDGSLNQLTQFVGGISWVGLVLIGYAVLLLRKK